LKDLEIEKWWKNFKKSNIDFIHTSSGSSHADSFFFLTKYDLHANDSLKWSFMFNLTKKFIIADIKIGLGGAAESNEC